MMPTSRTTPERGDSIESSDSLSPEVQARQQRRSSMGQQQQEQRRQHDGPAPKAEVFVVVRPPPSSIKHPLNLQVQLITSTRRNASNPPSRRSSRELTRSYTDASSFNAVAEASVLTSHSRSGTNGSQAPNSLNGTGRHSPAPPLSRSSSYEPSSQSQSGNPGADSDNEGLPLPGGGENLSRSASVRSTRSNASYASSTASGGSGMRKITPCYNLEFHSLQPTVVTDAGTDAKVARIHKRGIEMLDFAMLDPILLAQAGTIPSLAQRQEASKAAELARPSTSSSGADFAIKPAASLLNRFKRFSFRGSSSTANPQASDPQTPMPASPVGKRSSLFSPSSSTFAAAQQTASPQQYELPVVPLFREKTANDGGKTSSFATDANDDATPRPSISGPRYRHASGYTWVVRQYLRKDIEGKSGICDITFEWRKSKRWHKRGRRPGEQDRSAERRRSTYRSEDTVANVPRSSIDARRLSTSDTPIQLAPKADDDARPARQSKESETKADPSLSSSTNSRDSDMLSPHRTSRQMRAGTPDRSRSPVNESSSDLGSAQPEGAEDSEPESDPEDSEKPWICELVVRRPTTSPTTASTTTQRVLLGTLTPAPHHPKLVAHLAIPSSLTAVDIGNTDSGDDLDLSVEELKDVMTVTALWLVVRENLGLGGITKARKGEGQWRFTTPSALKSG